VYPEDLYLQVHVPREARAGSVAPFQLHYTLEYPFTASTTLTLAFSFPPISIAAGSELICFIADTIYPCSLAGSIVTFSTSASLPAGYYLFLITTRLADSYEDNGLIYPASGTYTVTMTFSD